MTEEKVIKKEKKEVAKEAPAPKPAPEVKRPPNAWPPR